MIQRVFVDTDIILDVALGRKPFFAASKMVLALMENNIAIGFTSSNCIANIYYILRKAGGDSAARLFLSRLLEYVTVIPIDHSTVIDALRSEFADFEDALQHHSAIDNRCECIVTRNTADYRASKISVYLPLEFIRLHQRQLE